MQDDRRRHLRFDANITGEFQVRGAQIKGLLSTNNFSRGGFKAILNKKLEEGVTLDCEMTFPETIMPFFSTGKVVWVNDSNDVNDSKFNTGIKLESMDPSERQFLIDYCYKKWNESRESKADFDIET